MCGRTSLFHPKPEVEERFDAQFAFDYEPRYNIAPASDLAVITNDAPGTIDAFHWGFVPHWADDPADGPRPINARVETAAETPTFRDAVRSKRCLVPSSGFYEWQGDRGGRTPYRIHPADDGLFAFAGLWDRWNADGEAIASVAILTCDAAPFMDDIHDRMPVILDPEQEARWLAGEWEAPDALAPRTDGIATYRVSTAVNDPANDRPGVVAESDQSGLGAFG
jgi:putative SOS response-associated peptidase YedK